MYISFLWESAVKEYENDRRELPSAEVTLGEVDRRVMKRRAFI